MGKARWKRLGAWILALVLLFGAVPDWGLLTRAAAEEEQTGEQTGEPAEEPAPAPMSEKLPFEVDSVGKYISAGIQTGNVTSYIMNGAISPNLKTSYYGRRTLGSIVISKGVKQITLDDSGDTDQEQNVTFLSENRNGMEENVSSYNMWRQFGEIDNGKVKRNPAPGFSTKDATYVNSGSLADDSRSNPPLSGIGRNANSGSWSATLKIADNPTLKALAETGNLQFCFSGLACGAKKYRESLGVDDFAEDYHTKVSCAVKLNGNELTSAGTTDGPWTKGLYVGWTDIGPNDTLEFTVSASKKNGNAGKVVGIGAAVLLFRKDSLPKLDTGAGFVMKANGDYRVSDTGRDQVLLGQTASMDLSVKFKEPVKPGLEGFTNSADGAYTFMAQFCNHTLFTNLNNTGFYRAGEDANLVLNQVNETNIFGASDLVTAAKQIAALNATNGVKSLNFHWDGTEQYGYGDYYGNNPVPNTGDWLIYATDASATAEQQAAAQKQTLASNQYGFLNKFMIASWHDLAGNPLADADGNIYTLSDNTGKISADALPKCTLTVQRKGGSVQKTVTDMDSPFTYDFIIDTVPPTYSITSNGVQPDILTGLALNKNDEYDLTVNFSEGVQVKRFTDTGAETGYQNSNVCLQFKENSDMKATYVSGGGTQNWVFHAIVKDGAAYETSAMDLTKVVYQGNSSLTTVLTDYVGNPLKKASETFTGVTSETPSISWAALRVDNTPPTITITRDSARKFIISATDSGSGVFAPPSDAPSVMDSDSGDSGDTSGSNKALIVYVWVEKDKKDEAIETLTANNYAAVKRFTLTAEKPDDYQLSYANIGGGKTALVELDESLGDAEWVLLVFETDMTWDTARQLIQYNKYKSYKNTESGAKEYYEAFMESYGGAGAASKAVEYNALTDKPDNWETNYFDYYTASGSSSYAKIPQTNSYPEFEAGRVYQAGYSLLDADPTAGDDSKTWNDVYTQYYIQSADGGYEHPAQLPAYPPFEENKYYVQYALVTDETEPDNWMTSTSYYELVTDDDSGTESYQQVKQNQVPTFDAASTLTVTFTPLPTSKKVSVQDKNDDDTAKVDTDGNPVYIFVAENEVATKAAQDAEGNPVYETDASGGKVYQYYDASGAVLTDCATTLQSEVTDAILKANEYWVKQAPDDASNKVYELATSAASGLVYYTATETAVATEPSDWATKYGDYYNKVDAVYNSVSSAVEGGAAPAWESGKYYSGQEVEGQSEGEGEDAEMTYTALSAQPSDWSTNYSKYYFQSGEEYTPALGIPTWKENQYYSGVADEATADGEVSMTYTLLTAKPDNWDKLVATDDGETTYGYTKYYFATPVTYMPVSATNVNYQASAFYKKASDASGYDLLAERPSDWASAYNTRYYIKDGNSYKLIPENVVEFKTETYYKTGYIKEDSEPSDWSTTATGGKYYWYVGPTSTAESARTEFVALMNLPKRMLGLYDVKSGGVTTSASDSTLTLVSAPAFASGSYYEATLSVDELLKKFTDEERKKEFQEAIIKAETNMDKMKAISAYSEFAEALTKVDRKLMQESGKYENWSVSDYRQEDSNWAYKVSDAVEGKKPVISLGAEGVQNDDSSNVTVPVKISEDTALVDKTKYKFVPAGTEVSETDDTLWQNVALSSMTETTVADGKEYTFTLSTEDFSTSMENGSYDLYVRAEDGSENKAMAKVATVTIDRSAEIFYALLLTEDAGDTVIAGTEAEEVNMTTSQRKSVDLSVKFAGKIDGGDLFGDAAKFKLFWAVDANATKTDSDGWTELTDGETVPDAQRLNSRTTKRYAIGEVGEKTGLYYLHLRYAYTRSGEETTQYLNKAFSLNATAPVVTLNVLSSTDTEVIVQATVSSSSEIASSQYAWVAGDSEEGAAWKDVTLPAQLSVTSSDAIAKEKDGEVSLFVKVTDSLGNEAMQSMSFVVAGEQAPVAAPNPSVSLLDVQQLSDGYYAVAKLDLPEGELPDAGSAYSTAIVKNGGEEVWSRWMPYESMVRVKICDSAADLSATQLQFKFMSSTGTVTVPANYVKISAFSYPFTSTQPWAVISRSTLQPVGMDTGVKLRFTPKTGAAVTAATDLPENALTSSVDSAEGYATTVHQSGLYVYNVTRDGATLPLYVSVSNIPPKTAPSWKMSFSTIETSAEPVTATLTIDEGVSVDEVIFQADPVTVTENGETTTVESESETVPALTSYTFLRNGAAYFKLSNVSGGTTTAKAVVSWIDAEAPEVTITPDYGAYQTITDSAGNVQLASGVKLQLGAGEVINVYLSSAQYENAQDQYSVGQAFAFNVPGNQEYQFYYRDRYGNSASASYVVSNLVTALPAPDVEVSDPDDNNRVTVTIRGQIPAAAVGVDGYKLYAGITTLGDEISVASDGSYVYSATVTVNGVVKNYICDNLNNTASYTFSVASIDLQGPVVEVKDTAWITQGDNFEDINWWDYVTATDNVTPRANLKLTAALDSGTAVNTSVSGSYRVRVTVTDEVGNEGYADVYLYVMPKDGMLITDQRGVLFYSKSNDVSLVSNDRIQLTVSRYQMMSYGVSQETVTNSDMTFDIFIQKGIYREGQLKYIQTVSFREQGGETSKTVDIKPEDLEGAGWYTIIVRNSEREREFTTFFINSTVLK